MVNDVVIVGGTLVAMALFACAVWTFFICVRMHLDKKEKKIVETTPLSRPPSRPPSYHSLLNEWLLKEGFTNPTNEDRRISKVLAIGIMKVVIDIVKEFCRHSKYEPDTIYIDYSTEAALRMYLQVQGYADDVSDIRQWPIFLGMRPVFDSPSVWVESSKQPYIKTRAGQPASSDPCDVWQGSSLNWRNPKAISIPLHTAVPVSVECNTPENTTLGSQHKESAPVFPLHGFLLGTSGIAPPPPTNFVVDGTNCSKDNLQEVISHKMQERETAVGMARARSVPEDIIYNPPRPKKGEEVNPPPKEGEVTLPS